MSTVATLLPAPPQWLATPAVSTAGMLRPATVLVARACGPCLQQAQRQAPSARHTLRQSVGRPRASLAAVGAPLATLGAAPSGLLAGRAGGPPSAPSVLVPLGAVRVEALGLLRWYPHRGFARKGRKKQGKQQQQHAAGDDDDAEGGGGGDADGVLEFSFDDLELGLEGALEHLERRITALQVGRAVSAVPACAHVVGWRGISCGAGQGFRLPGSARPLSAPAGVLVHVAMSGPGGWVLSGAVAVGGHQSASVRGCSSHATAAAGHDRRP